MLKKNKKGFTLIELLIVMGALSIIATFVVVSFNSARVSSRDTKRVQQIKEIRTALELYYNRHKAYPTAITPGQTFSNNGVVYIDPVPANPTPRTDGGCLDSEYSYTPVTGNVNYTLNFCLGTSTGGYAAGDMICDSNGCASSPIQ